LHEAISRVNKQGYLRPTKVPEGSSEGKGEIACRGFEFRHRHSIVWRDTGGFVKQGRRQPLVWFTRPLQSGMAFRTAPTLFFGGGGDYTPAEAIDFFRFIQYCETLLTFNYIILYRSSHNPLFNKQRPMAHIYFMSMLW